MASPGTVPALPRRGGGAPYPIGLIALLATILLAPPPAAWAVNFFGSKTPATGHPAPPTELRVLDYFRGTWICTGVVEPRGEKPAHLTKGKATYKWDLGNFFQAVTNQDDRTKDDPTPRLDRGYLGYDAATKEYTLALFFVGGGRTIGASPGWTDDGLKFVGDSSREGERMHIEQSFTRKTDTEYLSVVEATGADGKMTKVFHEKCVKNGK